MADENAVNREVMIHFRTLDGSELEERWRSLDAFLNWAQGEGLRGDYTVYEEDEDGDWLVQLRGTI